MIRVVKLSFKPAHSNDFNELFEDRKEQIKSFQGCTYLELWQDHNELGVFYTYSISTLCYLGISILAIITGRLMSNIFQTYSEVAYFVFGFVTALINCWFPNTLLYISNEITIY
jgi:hypothetical protein